MVLAEPVLLLIASSIVIRPVPAPALPAVALDTSLRSAVLLAFKLTPTVPKSVLKEDEEKAHVSLNKFKLSAPAFVAKAKDAPV